MKNPADNLVDSNVTLTELDDTLHDLHEMYELNESQRGKVEEEILDGVRLIILKKVNELELQQGILLGHVQRLESIYTTY